MQPKYKTERHLKERLYELAVTNKRMLDVITFIVQDLEVGATEGLSKEACEAMLQRTVNYVKETSNAGQKV